MPLPRLARHHKVVSITVIAMLLAAWILAATNRGVSAEAGDLGPGAIPNVPTIAFEEPATVESTPPGIGGASTKKVLKTLSADGIPAPALAAYRRAEALLGKADHDCNLPWYLVAAIGRVESNHGRINGSHLSAAGEQTPAFFGPPLNGTNGTARIEDTDHGVVDSDPAVDRAAGPMQFVPSGWQAVAVDADRDGHRRVQDIDDAATATGIYLCAGFGDLSQESDARAALARYNKSDGYADLVMAIATAYADGGFTVTAARPSPSHKSGDKSSSTSEKSSGTTSGGSSGGSSGSDTGGSTGDSTPTSAPPAPKPTATTAPPPTPKCDPLSGLLHWC